MESVPYFNCAKGGSMDVNDEVVTDAAIITPENAGCVGAVRDIEHPIALARMVLEKTEHILIVENGAQKFALDNGVPILAPGSLNVPESSMLLDSGEDVAYDRKRRLASGTSTAGDSGKPIGYVTATGTVIGCGVFANEHGCVSVSGNDTCIYCYAPARKICERLPRDATINYSLNTELENLQMETGESHIGAVAVNAKGDPSIGFKSMHFPWAFCRYGYVYYGIVQNESFSEKVTVLERPLDCMCDTSSGDDD
nr:isoaspartyl peptidase/L-asparaginase-like [Megalopta genalis]